MTRVVLHVDRLVLRGFDPGDRDRIAADLQRELGRLLADPTMAGQLASLPHVSGIRMGNQGLGKVEDRVSSGVSAARSIARGLTR